MLTDHHHREPPSSGVGTTDSPERARSDSAEGRRGAAKLPAGRTNCGTLLLCPQGYSAQFSIGGGKRKAALLRTCRTKEAAEARKVAIAGLIDRLRHSGHAAMVPNVIRDAAKLDDAEMVKLALLVDRIASGQEPGIGRTVAVRRDGMTLGEVADLWTSGDLARQFPDHVRTKKSSADDARILAWFGKVRMPDGRRFGELPLKGVTLDDCDHIMAGLPKTVQTRATRRHYAQALRKVLQYAVYPLRVLETLPIPKGWLPAARCDKAKAWIYPAEDAALAGCPHVPLARRLFFGVLVREGMRVGEALGLTWSDLDLDRGVIRLDQNKTGDPRSWVLGSDVVRALAGWRRVRSTLAVTDPHVFPRRSLGDRGDLAERLREDLELAGIGRPELLLPKAGRMLLRVHDLRGSFVTLALACGRTEAWVTDRTGHRSSQMIYLYKRAARTAAELGLGWLSPLDELIPEFAMPPAGPPPRAAAAAASVSGELSLLGSTPSSGVALGTPAEGNSGEAGWRAEGSSGGVKVCTETERAPPAASGLAEEHLARAIERLSMMLGTAQDEDMQSIIDERRSLRDDLRARRERQAGNVVRLGLERRDRP